ncbi:MAG: hypothetical protein K6E73_08490 [Bacteroidales bacterium]|nr:hypothetical protein [Bacteroidales bacterium]
MFDWKFSLGTFLSLISCMANGQDSIPHKLGDVVVSAQAYKRGVRGVSSGNITWEISSLSELPQFMSATDPIRVLQLLPGIQTSSELDAGLHIEGCESSHNAIQLDGVTVYNPAHLFGFFSVFNSSHFHSVQTNLETNPAMGENRLGGIVNVKTSSLQETEQPYFDGTVGLMSSQGTVHIANGGKMRLTASARKSYVNWLYSRWLEMDDYKLRYGLEDYNLTLDYFPTAADRLWMNFYWGKDHLNLSEEAEQEQVQWGNNISSLHWTHQFENQSYLEQCIYRSCEFGDISTLLNNSMLDLSSGICDFGYKGSYHFSNGTVGFHYIRHDIRPQHPKSCTLDTSDLKSDDYQLFAEKSLSLTERLSIRLGLSGNIFCTDNRNLFCSADPNISFSLTYTKVSFKIDYGWNHQYLHQSGLSAIDLPSDFWYSASTEFRPQYAQRFSFSHIQLLDDGEWSVSTKTYFKRLWHQCEYIGNLYDLLYHQDDYNLQKYIQACDSWNYGINVMLQKKTGHIVGWASYSWGRSLRRNHDIGRVFPSSHERIHELNMMANWHINPHWVMSSTYIFASGTPFTAPQNLFVLNGRVVSNFAPYNANRLPGYQRWDASASFRFWNKARKVEHVVNLSIYNLSGSDNPVFYRLKFHNGKYGYKPLKLVSFPLPSLSYHVTI